MSPAISQVIKARIQICRYIQNGKMYFFRSNGCIKLNYRFLKTRSREINIMAEILRRINDFLIQEDEPHSSGSHGRDFPDIFLNKSFLAIINSITRKIF